MSSLQADRFPAASLTARPRLGFLGLGWIGRSRLEELNGLVEVVALADPNEAALSDVRPAFSEAVCCRTLEYLLQQDLEGVVIATPSAQHAEQCLACLERGLAVFCQKPL